MLPRRSPIQLQTRHKSFDEVPRRITSLGLSSGPGWATGSRTNVAIMSPGTSPESSPAISRASTPTPMSPEAANIGIQDMLRRGEEAQRRRNHPHEGDEELLADGAPDAPLSPQASVSACAPADTASEAGTTATDMSSLTEPSPGIYTPHGDADTDAEIEPVLLAPVHEAGCTEDSKGTTSTSASTTKVPADVAVFSINPYHPPPTSTPSTMSAANGANAIDDSETDAPVLVATPARGINPRNSLQLYMDDGVPCVETVGGASSPPRPDPVSPLDPVSPWPPRDVPDDEPASSAKSTTTTAGDLPSAKEVYGSLAILLTYLAFGTYLFWAFAPIGSLDKVGWTWYPAREWATIVPSWLMLIVLLTYVSYAGLTFFLTPGLQSKNIMIDDCSAIRPASTREGEQYYWQFAERTAVPQAVDLPLDVVNSVLYPRKQSK